MAEFHEQWEQVAQTDDAHKAIASAFYHNEKYYNLSGVITLAPFFAIVADLYGPNCQDLDIVEIGCGTGRETKYLAECFRDVFAVDASLTMIEKAEDRVKAGNIHWFFNKSGDLSFLEYDNMDIVYSNIVLQHCKADTVKQYFDEAFRVLKPGGRFIFQLGIDLGRDSDPVNFDDIGYRTKETLERDLKAAGFIVESLTALHFSFHVAQKPLQNK